MSDQGLREALEQASQLINTYLNGTPLQDSGLTVAEALRDEGLLAARPAESVPRPVIDRDALLHLGDVLAALEQVYKDGAMGGEWPTLGADAVMELARPMPTREQIAAALRDHYPTTGLSVASGVTCQCGYWNGSESPGVDRPAGSRGRDGLNWHRSQIMATLLNGGES